jgi:DNA-binding Xre family transcriptional regulator
MKNRKQSPSTGASPSEKRPEVASRNPVREVMREGRRGTVAVCPRKFERAMTLRKTNISSIARGLKMSPNTLGKLAKGIAVNRSTLDRICRYLEVELEQLLPDEPDATSERRHQLTPPDGWVVEEYLSPVLEAANGLQYRIARLRNELVRNKQARGKFYDLLFVHRHREPTLREHLARHAHVCELVGRNIHIAENLDVLPLRGGGGWWVIDSWVEGNSLELEILNPASPAREPRQAHGIGRSVLLGLQALHEKNVIFRELAPDKVWIGSGMSTVFLTDFELAKLCGGEPSVSASTWSPDFSGPPN